MSLITIMNGVPLYTTKQEALRWALCNSVKGYHVHRYKGKTGYMGGATHSTATRSSLAKPTTILQQTIMPTPQMNQDQQRPVDSLQLTRPQPIVQPTPQRIQPIRRTPLTRRTSGGSGGGSGGSGGGGY